MQQLGRRRECRELAASEKRNKILAHSSLSSSTTRKRGYVLANDSTLLTACEPVPSSCEGSE